jgi:Putative threonine efflux protein
MNIPLLTAYVLAILTLLLTPGPVIALVTRAAARDGYGSAVRTMIGTNLASLTLIACAALMLTGIVALNPHWLAGLGMAGALYIAAIALGSLLPRRQPQARPEKELAARSGLIAGFLTGVANPKDILFLFRSFRSLSPSRRVSAPA